MSGGWLFLKRLEIYGFKSFGTKSVLDFAEGTNVNRVSAIVGPNGSGKSNVADAVRWVLGEQSSKTLRSKKNEDVIFCGSHTKPRGSFAEITMTLAQEEPFKIEVNGKEFSLCEISIGRKLYRSGESEYLINGKKVRLLDVQEVLARFGFGQSSYTVIGQGMVDRLLFFNPAERKVLFDEAAGVKQYEIKREQAIRKLEATDNNLIRLKDILSELEPRVVNLRRLVKRAEGRKEIESELQEIQNIYYLSQEKELSSKIEAYKKQKNDIQLVVEKLEKDIETVETKIEESQKNIEIEKEQAELESELETATRHRDELLQKVAYLEGKLNQGEHRLGQVKSEKDSLGVERANLEEKLTFLATKIEQENNELIAETAQKDEVNRQLSGLEEKRLKLEKSISELGQGQESVELEALKDNLRKFETEKRQLEDELYRVERNEKNLENINKELEKLILENEELKEKKSDAQRELSLKQKKAESLSEQILLVEKSLGEYLVDFDQKEIEVFEIELKAVFDEFETIGQKLTSSDSVNLVKTFFSKLSGIFDKTRKIVKSLNRKERSNFEESLRKLRSNSREIEIEINKYLIEVERVENQLAYMTKRISELKDGQKTLLTDGKDTAEFEKIISALKQKIEKTHEEISTKSKGTTERKQHLYSEINQLHQEESGIRRKVYELEIQIGKKRNTIDNQTKEIDSSERRLDEIKRRLTEIEAFKIDTDPVTEKELETKKAELDNQNDVLSKLRGKLSEALSLQRQQNQAIFELERQRRNYENDLMKTQNELNQLSLEEARYLTRLEDLNSEIKIAEIKLNRSVTVEVLSQNEKDALRVKMENLRRRLESIGGVDPETEAEYIELEERSSAMTEQVADLDKAKEDLEKVVRELDVKIKKQFSEVFGHIAEEFNRYFQILFNGGKASLSLGEDEEGNYGIEITANPPGKRLQSLNVLSGGERTLTSLALVFAILSINPSPFCLLDEVDAALDESNTIRFTKILEDLAKKTQFLVISHNRDTMKVADSLYGITMDNDHLSKLISIRLSEALQKVK